jgi:hypothetical protein
MYYTNLEIRGRMQMSKQDTVYMDSEVVTVTVIHSENQDADLSVVDNFEPDEAVAEVTYFKPLATYDGKLHEGDVDNALGYAWRWTNNVNGSWSRKEEQLADEDGLLHENGDYNEDVKVLLPNPTHAGKVWGRRSSMVGDIFILNTKAGSTAYSVDDFGFSKIEVKNPDAVYAVGEAI